MIFDSPAQTVFIDTHTPALTGEGSFNIILSPSFYWVKRMALPVKYLREVKKLLPSIFEEILPEGTYSYSAYREEDEYLLFAYSDKLILDALADKGIRPAQIKKVYFAQSEFGGMETPIDLGDGFALSCQNGVVVKLPAVLIEGAQPYDTTGHKLSRQGVELARYAHIADSRSQLLAALSMVLLIALFAFEWAFTASRASAVDAQRAEVFEQHGLQQTRLQNSAVLERLEREYERQRKVRVLTAALLGMKLQQEESLQRYKLEASKMTVEFALSSRARVKTMTTLLDREGAAYQQQYKAGILRLEVAL